MSNLRNKNISIILLITLLLLTIGSLVYTQDLEQRNSEKIFLTQASIESYEKFEEEHPQKSILIVQSQKADHRLEIIKKNFLQLCQSMKIEDCAVLGPNDIPKQASDFIKLSSDKKNIQILSAPIPREKDQIDPIKEIIPKLKKQFPKLQFAGIAYTNFLLDQYSKSIKKVVFPALFASVFVLLVICLKSLREAIIIFVAPLMASAVSLLVTKVTFGTSTLITSIVPLLLFIINLSLILHIHHTAKELGNMKDALVEKKEPIFLMAFTTFIGFGSLYFSKLEAISHFGALCSCLFLITTALCVIWPWTLSQIFPNLWRKREPLTSNIALNKSLLYKMSIPWSLKRITLFSTVAIFLGVLSYPKIPIITDATEYFPSHEKVKETMQQMAKEIIGSPIIEIVIAPKTESFTIKELDDVLERERKILEDPHLKILSSNQLVLMANSIYAKERALPRNILAYYTLLSKAPNAMNEGYGHDEGYRITVLGGPTNIEDYERLVDKIKHYFEGYEISFNGLYYHLMVAQKEMVITLFFSFSISLLIISICALLYFKKIKLFFIFLVVNIIPVLGSFPILWFIGNSFNVATVMTYSISLGLIVDSSFHIIHALNLLMKGQQGKDKHYFYKSITIPIIQSSLLLTFCFSFFSMSDFLPIREFGLSLSIVIFLGMILDLKVLPSLYKGR